MTLTPIHYYAFDDESMSEYFRVFRGVSLRLWGYFGYTGLMEPWHDSTFSKQMFRQQDKKLIPLIKLLVDNDIDIASFCILVAALVDYQKFENPALLYGNRSHWVWVRELREYLGSRELLQDVADFVMAFMELQVKHKKIAHITMSHVVGKVGAGDVKGMVTYRMIGDRIFKLREKGIDWREWMETKFDKALEVMDDKQIMLRVIVNPNSFDPDLDVVQQIAADTWKEMRAFLKISKDCDLPDGHIPKGWQPSQVDFEDPAKIIRIQGDGFYFFEDETQRRGKFHYMGNKYLIIKCDPSNFHEFKEGWLDKRMLVSTPTWDEYCRFAAFPGRWDALGNTMNGRGKEIKWRRK